MQAILSPIPVQATVPELPSVQVHKQWFATLNDILRAATPRVKKLQQQLNKEGRFLAEPSFALISNYVKFCSQSVTNMNKWYSQTLKILDEDMLYFLNDLEDHLRAAEGA